MPPRELKTLLNLKFADTRVGARSHLGVRSPRISGIVNFTARLGDAWRRMIYAPIRTLAPDEVSVLSLRDLTAVKARIG